MGFTNFKIQGRQSSPIDNFFDLLYYILDEKSFLCAFKTWSTNLDKKNIEYANQLNDLGVEEAKTGNFKEALKFFERAHNEDFKNYEIIRNIGNCKMEFGDKSGACEKWKKAADNGDKKALEMVEKYCK